MKSYTDIEQSKKLAEILPLESADGFYAANVIITEPYITYLNGERNIPGYKGAIPCWSLAALLEVLELPTLEKNGIGNGKTGWMVTHYDVDGMRYDTPYYNNPIDACYQLILTLHELKML